MVENKPITDVIISFGDVFSYSGDPEKKYVIVDTGEKNWCHASQIVVRDGLESVGFPGSTTREDMLDLVEKWNLERVIKAFMITLEDQEPIGKIYDLIREKSGQNSRLLK